MLSGSSQYLNTQGNGVIPTGKYLTQDGVHLYREWAVVRQHLSPATLIRTDYKRAKVAEAVSETEGERRDWHWQSRYKGLLRPCHCSTQVCHCPAGLDPRHPKEHAIHTLCATAGRVSAGAAAVRVK
jgi:hypothetical protein